MAYVGKYFDGWIWNSGRVQTSEPGKGVYTFENGKLVNHPNGGQYLVDNPNNHYYWIDSPSRISSATNAVSVKVNNQSKIALYIGRLQVDGQVQIGTASDVGFAYADQNGALRYAKNFQILACDPRPANKCSKFLSFSHSNKTNHFTQSNNGNLTTMTMDPQMMASRLTFTKTELFLTSEEVTTRGSKDMITLSEEFKPRQQMSQAFTLCNQSVAVRSSILIMASTW
jgi:hypothetical protein